MENLSSLITAEHLRQFDQHGYFLLPSVIPPEHIAIMTDVIQRAIYKRNKHIEQILNDSNTKAAEDGFILYSADGKYFFFMHEDSEPEMNKIIFSTYMEAIVKAVLGNNAYYTHSEIVVKRGEGEKAQSGTTYFSWHQDSGYVPYQHTPYLSCWCALTEMTSENGTISVLPIERNPTNDENHRISWSDKPRPDAASVFPCFQHRKDSKNDDMVGYFGNDPGVEIVCPAGSIAVFSSLTLHCSAANRSDTLRSAFNVQYAPVPLMSADNQSFRHKADPFIIHSEVAPEIKKWQPSTSSS